MFFPLKNPEFVKTLLSNEENEELDYKLNISDSYKIAKTLVAFANTKGGIIAIGINDQKIIKGIDPEEELFMIEKASSEYCEPKVIFSAEVYEIEYLDEEKLDENLYILIVSIPKSMDTHYLKHKNGELIKYTRKADNNLPDIYSE
ncbi:helix-turn-helix domain-containing protein [Belliella marina]|uniref:Helix-turn-helix domain-containing protein n=1 Tax=Belliella marina TaxID=1644146 RepID=A0ABW4VMJ4_9BACT